MIPTRNADSPLLGPLSTVHSLPWAVLVCLEGLAPQANHELLEGIILSMVSLKME